MKFKHSYLTQRAVALLMLTTAAGGLAQGPLAPSGAPAPTFKTLDQVEPRIPISLTTTPGDADSAFKITSPGSYYLAGNITGSADKHGIEIAASDVTLDLMGYRLLARPTLLPGQGPSLTGVLVTGGQVNICIRNGTIKNWSQVGVDAASSTNGQYQDLRLSGNGQNGLSCGSYSSVVNCVAQGNGGAGIYSGQGSFVHDCIAHGNENSGIQVSIGARVSSCTALDNGERGIMADSGSMVQGCSARGNGADGIYVENGSTVSASTAYKNQGNGIQAQYGCTLRDNTANLNTGHGIRVPSECHVVDNSCDQNGFGNGDGAGIHADGGGNRIDGNNVTRNDRGIHVGGFRNLIIRNSADGNDEHNHYDITGFNRVGTIVFPPLHGGQAEITDPFSNFWL